VVHKNINRLKMRVASVPTYYYYFVTYSLHFSCAAVFCLAANLEAVWAVLVMVVVGGGFTPS